MSISRRMAELVGAPLKRKEDPRLLVGRGRYLEDQRLPGMVHLGVVRSPHAHARILKIDRAEASRLEGVLAVFTREDLPELGGGVPPLVPAPGLRPYCQPVLAGEKVRHVGEAVAAVVAVDPYRVADAVERVVVEYEPLPVAATAGAALSRQAPRVNDDWPDNLAGRTASGTGDVTLGFARAEVVVEAKLAYPRVAAMPIETRGLLAVPDPATGGLTVWVSTQVPFAVRSAIAAILLLPEERVRIIVPDVGGGFGAKGHVYSEDILVPAVARRLGCPVKWVESRREHFLATAADRDQEHHARLGLRRDGTIVALETTFTRDHGAYPTLGEAITQNTINHLPGPYRVPHYRALGRNVVTHKTFAAAYRGAGRPEAAFVLERLLDRAAHRLGMDPAELRRRNLIRPEEMPFRSGLRYRDGAPITYDPADYPAGFEKALALLDYAGWRTEQARRRGGAKPIGIGTAAYVEGTGLGPFEGAEIRVDPSGTVFVLVGVSSQGQAHETTLAQVCADALHVPIEDVVVLGGDTRLVGYGMGTIASRVAAVAGPAVARTASEVARKARLVAADLFECAAEDVVLGDGRVFVKGVPDKSLRLGDVARAAVQSKVLASAGGPGLSACAFFYPETVTWAFGAHAVVVEVDLATCRVALVRYVAVHDCGHPINPMVVEGQLHGGIVQGIGSALAEELVYSPEGQLLTATFMDYGLPRADQVPSLEVAHLEHPSTVNALGIKGVGESGIIAPAAAIANAVEDALADYGVLVDRVPLTGARLFECLRASGRWPLTPNPAG
ncbi:MAG: xanthine dehydrogenase family protein [Candidatus Rokubacteria bacterium]|nr:xanthine dehydrogenase family protein [Candidatus Rokubacteria bacterium]